MGDDEPRGSGGGLWARPQRRTDGWSAPEVPQEAGEAPRASVPPPPPASVDPSRGPVADAWARPLPEDGPLAARRPPGAPGGAVLPRFASLDGRARAARWALVAVAVTAVLVAWADVQELRLIDRIEAGALVTESETDANDLRVQVADLLQLIAFLAAGVTFVRWMNLAYRGLDALGAARRFHTGWSIGGWFVPVLNVWRPKQVANDLWAAGRREGEPETSGLLLAWWLAWLVTSALSQVVGRLVAADDDSLAAARRLDQVDLAASVTDVVGAVLAILVIGALTRRLHQRAGLPPS